LTIGGLLLTGLLVTDELGAQFVAPIVRLPERVKHIWSPNKNFVADILFDDNVTKIGKVDWQGNVGRTTWLWSMVGAPEQGWLSNDRNYLIQETRTSGGRSAGQFLLKRENGKEWLIEGLVEDVVEYPREFPTKNFEEFVFERASAMYSADGCDSSTSVAEFVNKKRFVTPNHLDALEFYLVLQDSYYDEAGTTKNEKRTVGPVYAISISGLGEPQRVLFLRLANGQEDKASRENATLKAIAETIWAFTTPR
jgi:hypothetical protein